MLASSLLAAMWFGVFVLLHIAVSRVWPSRGRFQALLAVFLAALLAQMLSVLLLGTELEPARGYVLAVLTGWVVMLSLFVLYAPFYYTFAASLSVQTVIALQRAPGQRLPLAELRSRFNSEAFLRHRLDSMVATGNLSKEGAAYRLTPKGRSVARVFGSLKRLWRLGPGG
jgi:hypothetical protein